MSYVQESITEDLELKKPLWKKIDAVIQGKDRDVILASSTTAIIPSKLSEDLQHREKFIVAHPVGLKEEKNP